MELRCDGKMDCSDGTDEDECNIIVPDLGYNKFIVPPPVNGKDVLEVKFSVVISDLLDIDEVAGSVNMKFQLIRDWYDPRVTFQNVKTNSDLNVLTPADKESLWVPWIVFDSVKDLQSIHKTAVEDSLKIVTGEKYKFKVIL